MAAVREELVDTSNKLKLAFSDLEAIDDKVAALTVGVGDLPLSEAAARVSQGARSAVAMASKVMTAAELAQAAAGKAAAAAAKASEETKAAVKIETARKAAATETEAVAVPAHTAVAAAALEAATLEVKIEPPVPFDHTYEGYLAS